MKHIDKLLVEAAKRHINDKRVKAHHMTNEELDEEIRRLNDLLGIEDDISIADLRQRIKKLWNSMTLAEQQEAELLSKKRW